MNKKINLSLIASILLITGNLYANSNNVVKEEIVLETSPEVLISKDIYFAHLKDQKAFENELLKLEIENLNSLKLKESLRFEIERIRKSNEVTKLISKENQIKSKQLELEDQKLTKQLEYVEKYPYEALGFKVSEEALMRNVILANLEEQKDDTEMVLSNNKKLSSFKDNSLVLEELSDLNSIELKKSFIDLDSLIKNNSSLDQIKTIRQKIEILSSDFDSKLSKLMFKSDNTVFNENFLTISTNLVNFKSLIKDIVLQIETGLLTGGKYKNLSNNIDNLLSNNSNILKDLIVQNQKIISGFSEKNIVVSEEEQEETLRKEDYSNYDSSTRSKLLDIDRNIELTKESINLIGTPQKELLRQILSSLNINYTNLTEEEIRTVLLSNLKELYKNKFEEIVSYEMKIELEKKKSQEINKLKERELNMKAQQERESRLKYEQELKKQEQLKGEAEFIKSNLFIQKSINDKIYIKNAMNGEVISKQVGDNINGWRIISYDKNSSNLKLKKENIDITMGMEYFNMDEFNQKLNFPEKNQLFDMAPNPSKNNN